MGSNAKIIELYKKRNKNTASIILRSNEPAKEKARRETEKVLIILTIFKSVQISNEFFIKLMHSCLNTFKTGFNTCDENTTDYQNCENYGYNGYANGCSREAINSRYRIRICYYLIQSFIG